jgi:hypothetical protein
VEISEKPASTRLAIAEPPIPLAPTSGLSDNCHEPWTSDPVPPGADVPMTTPVENPGIAAPPLSPAPGKMRQLLRKRLRQLLWATLGLAVFLVVAGGILGIWWLTSLNGLPDIEDPFDVAKFRAFRIPDDQNAFTYFRRAEAKLTLLPELPRAVIDAAPTVPWADADPKLRAWVEANRAALEIFQQGADQADGISRPAGESFSVVHQMVNHGGLMRLAFLEGARREEGGDTAGAWDCYRSVLRMTNHLRGRGDIFETSR